MGIIIRVEAPFTRTGLCTVHQTTIVKYCKSKRIIFAIKATISSNPTHHWLSSMNISIVTSSNIFMLRTKSCTIVQDFVRNINMFELVTIDIFIELNQWCVGFEEIVAFIANIIRFDLQYFTIVVWCTVHKPVRVKGASTLIIIPIVTVINLWHFLCSGIKLSYYIRIVLNGVNITIFTNNTTNILFISIFG